jgi:hypothetical protein
MYIQDYLPNGLIFAPLGLFRRKMVLPAEQAEFHPA